MDPITIATASLGLLTGIAKVSRTVNDFVQNVRSARSELDAIGRELISLNLVVELLSKDAQTLTGTDAPPTLVSQITGILTNCMDVVGELNSLLEKLKNERLDKAARWAVTGRDHAKKLHSHLEAHKSALQLALHLIHMYICASLYFSTASNPEQPNDTEY
jgi:Fungal N-terminal domain of STAND proteins